MEWLYKPFQKRFFYDNKKNNNKSKYSGLFYFLRQGLFFRGYNEATMLLNVVLGYQVLSREIKSCGKLVYYADFPSSQIKKVSSIIKNYGGNIDERLDNVIQERLLTSALLKNINGVL